MALPAAPQLEPLAPPAPAAPLGGPSESLAPQVEDLAPQVEDLPSLSIDHVRQALLRSGLATDPAVLGPVDFSDGATMIPHAHATLLAVMVDPSSKGAEKVSAADSILDRYGSPRKRVDQGGGSKQVIFNLSPDAFAGVAQGIAALAGGLNEPLPTSPPAPRNVSPVHGPGPSSNQSNPNPNPSGQARGFGQASPRGSGQAPPREEGQ